MNINGGSLKVHGLKSDTRIDSRGAEIELAMAAPAPVAIYSDGERVTVTPPPGGYTLDARIRDGRVTPDDFIASMGFSFNKAAEDNDEARVFGPIKGGGPIISVRASNADFTIRQADDKPKADEKPKPDELKKELKGR